MIEFECRPVDPDNFTGEPENAARHPEEDKYAFQVGLAEVDGTIHQVEVFDHVPVTGDWGELGDFDKQLNEEGLEYDLRLLSAYNLSTGRRIWIITEADRSATTLLLPEEY